MYKRQLYSEGRTIGTFQFESAGMQKYLRELEPSTFEDLIAMNALYRPGPMDYIPDFIDRKDVYKRQALLSSINLVISVIFEIFRLIVAAIYSAG